MRNSHQWSLKAGFPRLFCPVHFAGGRPFASIPWRTTWKGSAFSTSFNATPATRWAPRSPEDPSLPGRPGIAGARRPFKVLLAPTGVACSDPTPGRSDCRRRAPVPSAATRQRSGMGRSCRFPSQWSCATIANRPDRTAMTPRTPWCAGTGAPGKALARKGGGGALRRGASGVRYPGWCLIEDGPP